MIKKFFCSIALLASVAASTEQDLKNISPYTGRSSEEALKLRHPSGNTIPTVSQLCDHFKAFEMHLVELRELARQSIFAHNLLESLSSTIDPVFIDAIKRQFFKDAPAEWNLAVAPNHYYLNHATAARLGNKMLVRPWYGVNITAPARQFAANISQWAYDRLTDTECVFFGTPLHFNGAATLKEMLNTVYQRTHNMTFPGTIDNNLYYGALDESLRYEVFRDAINFDFSRRNAGSMGAPTLQDYFLTFTIPTVTRDEENKTARDDTVFFHLETIAAPTGLAFGKNYELNQSPTNPAPMLPSPTDTTKFMVKNILQAADLIIHRHIDSEQLEGFISNARRNRTLATRASDLNQFLTTKYGFMLNPGFLEMTDATGFGNATVWPLTQQEQPAYELPILKHSGENVLFEQLVRDAIRQANPEMPAAQ